MPLPQDISPLNADLADTLVRTGEQDWIPMALDPERAFLKVLYTGSESGRWGVIFRWLKGFVAPQHKHLSASHTFILTGRLQVRDGILDAGDYVYEPNGVLHGATTALEDTDYIFICDGPILFHSEDSFDFYLGWEEIARMKAAFEAQKAQSAA